MLRPLEDILTLLTNAGFSAVHALHVYRLMFGFLYGHLLNELQELIDPALAAYDGAAELDRTLDILLPAITQPCLITKPRQMRERERPLAQAVGE